MFEIAAKLESVLNTSGGDVTSMVKFESVSTLTSSGDDSVELISSVSKSVSSIYMSEEDDINSVELISPVNGSLADDELEIAAKSVTALNTSEATFASRADMFEVLSKSVLAESVEIMTVEVEGVSVVEVIRSARVVLSLTESVLEKAFIKSAKASAKVDAAVVEGKGVVLERKRVKSSSSSSLARSVEKNFK